jgi:hypothetical protein
MLPYRTILRLPSEGDIIKLATQEVQTWLEDKVDRSHRRALADGDYFEPGIHEVGGGKSVGVARIERPDGGRGFLMRVTEPTPNGVYEVSVTAIDNVEHHHRQDSLVIEALRIDRAPEDFQVDPPRFVRNLLAREEVHDSRTHVTASPRLVRADDEDEVFGAITDDRRSVSVIVAASLGREYDDALRQRVKDLTANTVGVTAVFVADKDLVDRLNERLPRSHALDPGRVRTYLPGVDLDDPADGRRHRVLGPETFARGIRGTRVSKWLKDAFAEETRSALISHPLPGDARRVQAALQSELATLDRGSKIETRTRAALSASEARVPSAPSIETP